jgi:hypothetical protein
VRGPFGRVDARGRAQICLNEAETWDGVVREREQFAEGYEGEDRIAALAHVEIAKRRSAFCRELAEAYERVAKGIPPFAETQEKEA